MQLNRLNLTGFRNYSDLDIELSQFRQIALVGANAQGKSNFLEAVYLLAFVSSYRTQRLQELIHWNSQQMLVQGTFEKAFGQELDVLVALKHKGKRVIRINNDYQRRLQDCVGRVKLVFFSSRDLQLVWGAPSERRRFLDMVLAQAIPSYYGVLQTYGKVLKQRNSLLKSLKERNYNSSKQSVLEQLEAWTLQLSHYGSYLIHKRFKLLETLQVFVQETHATIADSKDILSIQYDSQIDFHTTNDKEMIQKQLLETFQKEQMREMKRGQTLVGPHRDDLIFMLNERSMRLFGSQGQMRTIALALKVSELFYLSERFNEPPLLLLDDVFAELDLDRQRQLLRLIDLPDVQTFLSTTHISDELSNFIKSDGGIFQVKQGQLQAL